LLTLRYAFDMPVAAINAACCHRLRRHAAVDACLRRHTFLFAWFSLFIYHCWWYADIISIYYFSIFIISLHFLRYLFFIFISISQHLFRRWCHFDYCLHISFSFFHMPLFIDCRRQLSPLMLSLFDYDFFFMLSLCHYFVYFSLFSELLFLSSSSFDYSFFAFLGHFLFIYWCHFILFAFFFRYY